MTMQVKKLNKGDVLWWHGEFATTIAFVDKGRLGIKTEDGLIGVVGPDGVIGESALLAEGGVVPKRRAAVIAIEESSVTEYPVSFVREGVGVGLPRKVLRTLIGQTITSACFILAAHPNAPLVTQSMTALIRSLSDSKEMVADVKNWTDFAPDFSVRVIGNCCKAFGCAGRPCQVTCPTSTFAAAGVLVGVGVKVAAHG